MSQQVVAALCAYRGGMIPGIKSAVNVAFKTIPALKPFQDLKKDIRITKKNRCKMYII